MHGMFSSKSVRDLDFHMFWVTSTVPDGAASQVEPVPSIVLRLSPAFYMKLTATAITQVCARMWVFMHVGTRVYFKLSLHLGTDQGKALV